MGLVGDGCRVGGWWLWGVLGDGCGVQWVAAEGLRVWEVRGDG